MGTTGGLNTEKKSHRSTEEQGKINGIGRLEGAGGERGRICG